MSQYRPSKHRKLSAPLKGPQFEAPAAYVGFLYRIKIGSRCHSIDERDDSDFIDLAFSENVIRIRPYRFFVRQRVQS